MPIPLEDLVSDLLRPVVCWIYRVGTIPQYNPLVLVPAVRAARDILFFNLCDTTPDQPPQFLGGQCEAEYLVSQTYQYRTLFNPSPVIETASVTILGPIGSGFIYRGEISTGSAFYAPNATGEVPGVFQLGTSINNQIVLGYQILSMSVSRIDGNPDNCGDGPPPEPIGWIREGDTYTTYVNETFSDQRRFQSNEFPFQITLPPFDGDGTTIPINLENERFFDIDLSGGSFSPNIVGSTANIIASAIPQLQTAVRAIQTINTVLDIVNNISGGGGDLSIILDRLDEGVDVNFQAELTRLLPTCQLEQVEVMDLGDAFQLLIQNQDVLRSRECLLAEQTLEVLLEGVSSLTQRVFQQPVARGTYGFLKIELLGELDVKQSYSVSNRATGFFGSLSPTIDGAQTNNEIIYEREGTINFLNPQYDGFRLFLKSDVQFRVLGGLLPWQETD